MWLIFFNAAVCEKKDKFLNVNMMCFISVKNPVFLLLSTTETTRADREKDRGAIITNYERQNADIFGIFFSENPLQFRQTVLL